MWCLVMFELWLQAKLQTSGGAARHIAVSVPRTVIDNGMPHQLPLTSEFMLLYPSCRMC